MLCLRSTLTNSQSGTSNKTLSHKSLEPQSCSSFYLLRQPTKTRGYYSSLPISHHLNIKITARELRSRRWYRSITAFNFKLHCLEMHRNFSVFLQVCSGAGGATSRPTLPPTPALQNPEVAQAPQPAHGPRGRNPGAVIHLEHLCIRTGNFIVPSIVEVLRTPRVPRCPPRGKSGSP